MNTTAIYSATMLHSFPSSTTPRISGFWASTPPQYIDIFSVYIRTTMSISITCCVLSLIILTRRKKDKSLAKKNIISLIGSLVIFELILFCELCNWNLDYAGCYAAAVISQWSQLSTVLWMNVLAFDIWQASSKIECHDAQRENHQFKRFAFYGLYAWGLPLVYVGISVVIDHVDSIPVQYKPNYVENEHRKCWACTWNYVIPNIIYSIVPCAMTVIVSFVFLMLTYRNIRKTVSLVEKVCHRRVRNRFMLYVKVTAFRDIGYIIGFIPLWETWYIVVTLISFGLNTLLGFYLFVLFVFNKKKLKLALSKWIGSVRSISSGDSDQ